MKKLIKPFKVAFTFFLQCLLVATLFIHTKIKFRVKLKTNGIKLPKEPSIYLCNHQTNWDPVFHRLLMPKIIYFLGHDELFKTKLAAWTFTNVFKTVKRGSSKNDIGAIKQLMMLKKKGKNIGVFPEGGIPYFGETLPIPDNIAKLCKKLDMPIVLHRIYGGALIYPRYNTNKARIRPVLERMRVLSREEVQNLSIEELSKIINENLYINEFKLQETRKLETKRKNPAEAIEKALYVCPHCHKFNTLKSSGNTIKCTDCGFYNIVDKYDLLQSPMPQYKYFNNYIEWNNFQTDYTKKVLIGFEDTKNDITSEFNLYVKICDIEESFTGVKEEQGSIELFKDCILITIGLNEYKFSYSDVNQAHVEFRSTLEIKFREKKVRFVNDEKIWSPYKMAKIINIQKEITK